MSIMFFGIRFRRARNEDALKRAELLRDTYTKCGYVDGARATIALPSLEKNIALVAEDSNDAIVGTIAITRDGTPDLAVEKEFPDEIRSLRKKVGKGKFAYIERFAVAEAYRDGKISLVLFAWVFLWVIIHARAVVAIVNPRHKKFYIKSGFQEITSKDKENVILVNAPAVLIVKFVDARSILYGAFVWLLKPVLKCLLKKFPNSKILSRLARQQHKMSLIT